MKWSELKEFCNSLPENELDKNVVLWREDEGINKINAEQLEEDHYCHTEYDEGGCFPLSDANDEDKPCLRLVYKKGHPVLWEDF